jgi:hypothetical protein
MTFRHYISVGDSMSTDHYPTCDVRDLDVPPARLDPLGAAALLYRNDDLRWPEFKRLDLSHLSPGVARNRSLATLGMRSLVVRLLSPSSGCAVSLRRGGQSQSIRLHLHSLRRDAALELIRNPICLVHLPD